MKSVTDVEYNPIDTQIFCAALKIRKSGACARYAYCYLLQTM